MCALSNFSKNKEGEFLLNKKSNFLQLLFFCGKGGIRTLDTVIPYTVFPGLLIRPL